MELLTVIFTAVVFIGVQAQTPIVDKTVIADGGTFTVTCDVNRFPIGAFPPNENYISELSMERTVGRSGRSPIVTYIPFPAPNFPNLTNPNIPAGRKWNVQATGGVGSGTNPTNNKNTIKIILIVNDAKCEDAGIYRCNATYTTTGGSGKVENFQNITAQATTGYPTLALTPQNGIVPNYSTNPEGDNVILSCKVQGPDGLVLSWSAGPPNGFNLPPYPNPNDIQVLPPILVSGSSVCLTYIHESKLNFTVQPVETMYICAVSDVISGNFTISSSTATNVPATGGNLETPSTANVGAIVGGVIGGLVLIAIIVIVVYFCWYRKRNDDDSGRDKEVEATDTTHAPPPVFYAEPKKAKKDERDGVRPDKGFTNEALDNSYDDSKDHRGPPQYINTVDGEDLPRYEQETHRGRSNRGYDDENEKNEGHGRRHRRDRKDKEDRDDRKPPRKDYDDRDKGRHYSTDDGTDNRDPQMGYGDPNMGTSI